MICPNCGNQTQPDAVFCDQCGKRLITPSATPPEAQPQTNVQPQAPARPEPSVPQEPEPAPQQAAPQQASEASAICPNCGASNTPGEMFCDECGTPLDAPAPEGATDAPATAQPSQPAEETETEPEEQPDLAAAEGLCPACGAAVNPDDAFCFACGAELTQVAAQPAAEQAPQPAAQSTEEPQAPERPAPQPEQPEAPTPEPIAAHPSECPTCGAEITPGDAFCEFCGAALVGPEQQAAAPAVGQPATAETATTPAAGPVAPSVGTEPDLAPRLSLPNQGIEIPLPDGSEVIVGREDPYSGIFPDVDLSPYGADEAGVSRRHFRIRRQGDQFTIEDLNSTNMTFLNRQQLTPGTPVPLSDGDEIRAGRLKLTFQVSP